MWSSWATMLGRPQNGRGVKTSAVPMVYGYSPDANYYFSIRIHGAALAAGLSHIDKTWKSYVPGSPVQSFFLSDSFESQFKSDERQGQMFSFFVGIAIFHRVPWAVWSRRIHRATAHRRKSAFAKVFRCAHARHRAAVAMAILHPGADCQCDRMARGLLLFAPLLARKLRLSDHAQSLCISWPPASQL